MRVDVTRGGASSLQYSTSFEVTYPNKIFHFLLITSYEPELQVYITATEQILTPNTVVIEFLHRERVFIPLWILPERLDQLLHEVVGRKTVKPIFAVSPDHKYLDSLSARCSADVLPLSVPLVFVLWFYRQYTPEAGEPRFRPSVGHNGVRSDAFNDAFYFVRRGIPPKEV